MNVIDPKNSESVGKPTWKRQSYLAFITQGLLLAVFMIILIANYDKLDTRDILLYLLLGSISIGIHSMLHFREEEI